MQNISSIAREERTLQLKVHFGKTLRSTVILLVILLFIGELIARQKSFQSLFIAPGMGSLHGHFEKQLGRLKRIVEEEGKIDCIIIGSSTVREGINPVQFRSAVKAQTGKDFSCFNFGVDGLAAAGAGVVAQILVEKYNPQLLIYGIDPRDFTSPLDAWENTTILDSPWIRYKLGKGDILGWLFDHSFLLRYQEPLRKVLHLQFYRELRRYQDFTDEAKWGYFPSTTPEIPVSNPPSQNPDSDYVKAYYKLLSSYQMLPENLLGFEQVLSLQNNGVQVLLVEMPVAPGYLDFFTNGYDDYETYIDRVNEYLEFSHIPFIRTQSSISIPINGWWDYNHLNERGTRIFSEWLAMKVGELYIEGTTSNLVPYKEN